MEGPSRVVARKQEAWTAGAASRGPLFTGSRMAAIHNALDQLAAFDVPVVFEGETGVGKEVLARELHSLSARASRPFLRLNCAAAPSCCG